MRGQKKLMASFSWILQGHFLSKSLFLGVRVSGIGNDWKNEMDERMGLESVNDSGVEEEGSERRKGGNAQRVNPAIRKETCLDTNGEHIGRSGKRQKCANRDLSYGRAEILTVCDISASSGLRTYRTRHVQMYGEQQRWDERRRELWQTELDWVGVHLAKYPCRTRHGDLEMCKSHRKPQRRLVLRNPKPARPEID